MTTPTTRISNGSITLFRVRGIPVRAHWTLFLIVPYIAVMFAAHFPRVASTANAAPEHVALPPLVWGALIAIGLFASVALHELAHSFVAIRFGGRVRDVTLMLIGGMSSIEHIPSGRGREAVMAFAGPATSLALGVLLLALHGVVPHGAGDGMMALFYLGSINLTLGVFNLIPAFPMDGGRVLRSLLEIWTGRRRATAIAATTGRVLAVGMGIAGLWLGSFLLILVAVFVYSGAGAEHDLEESRHAFAGVRVAEIADTHVGTVSMRASVAELPARMREAARTDLIVVDDLARPIGVVRADDVAGVEPADRAMVRVGDLDVVERSAVLVPDSATVADAMDQAAAADVEYVIVRDPIGLIGRRELATALALRTLQPIRT